MIFRILLIYLAAVVMERDAEGGNRRHLIVSQVRLESLYESRSSLASFETRDSSH